MMLVATAANAQKPIEMNLWPDGPRTNNGDPEDQAKIWVYLPDSKKATGRAVVCCPGGGYQHLAMQHEGHDWAPFFNGQGIALIVLKYRMPHGRHQVPLEDAEKAMKVVRGHADEWHINRKDVGIMGFSAGGHLASTLATHQGSRDNLLGKKPKRKEVNGYSNEQRVSKHTPRAFIALAGDDRSVPPANSLGYYEELCNNKVPATMHIYPAGGHGFGIRQSFPSHLEMMMELKAWLSSF